MSEACSVCSKLFLLYRNSWDLHDPWFQTWTRSSLATTADHGCVLCRILLAFDMRAYRGRRSEETYSQLLKEHPEQNLRFSFRLDGLRPSTITVTIPENIYASLLFLKASASDGDPAAKYIKNRPSYDRDGDPTFAWAKSALHNCDNTHACRNKYSRMPTRVLDVSGDSIRLTISKNTTDKWAPYAALSYCWGNAAQIITTTETIHEYKSNISYALLPQSMRDAVVVTRKLGVRYLWIDALCIIQDSAKDKESEISQMCDVYQNSYVTLVAASASASREGFLNTENSVPRGVSLPCAWEDKDEIGSIILSERTDNRSGTREPLHLRAWALQEIFLAPRLLIYGQHCVFWKCEQGEACRGDTVDWNGYCASAGITTTRLGRNGRIFRPALSIQAVDNPAFIFNASRAEQIPEIFRIWRLLIRDYSTRKLTDPGDKLLAMSGIVSSFQHVMQDDYIIGMWRKHLIHELSWMTQNAARPEIWRCPSWSWMSVDGHVTFQGDQAEWFEPLVDILECSVQPMVPTAPFGHIKCSVLQLRGYLKRNTFVTDNRMAFELQSNLLWDDEHRDCVFGKIVLDSEYLNPDQQAILSSNTVSQQAGYGILWCLMYANCVNRGEGESTKERIWGMVLAKKLWTNGTVFHRVGHFTGNQSCVPWFKTEDKSTFTII